MKNPMPALMPMAATLAVGLSAKTPNCQHKASAQSASSGRDMSIAWRSAFLNFSSPRRTVSRSLPSVNRLYSSMANDVISKFDDNT